MLGKVFLDVNFGIWITQNIGAIAPIIQTVGCHVLVNFFLVDVNSISATGQSSITPQQGMNLEAIVLVVRWLVKEASVL